VPTAVRVTFVPDTVHTEAVVDVNVTARPDDAIALTANAGLPNTWSESAPNAIVCPIGVTVKCWLTAGAAE
jgi:hypothetical protein